MKKWIYAVLARMFYDRQWCDFHRYSPAELCKIGFMQRVIGFNRDVPWPVHPSSIVCNWRKIRFKPGAYRNIGDVNGLYVQAENGIFIGQNLRIASGVKLISSNHDLNDYDVSTGASPIVIGDDCWLGANVVILPGVELGSHTVVAAGAVVNKSFPTGGVLLAGVPAEVKKHLAPYKH